MNNPDIRSAMRHLCQYAVDQGHVISLWDSVEWSIKRSRDVETLYQEMHGLDAVINLRIIDPSKDGSGESDYLGTASASAGLEGEEDVIDYTCTDFMDEWNNKFLEYIDELDEA